MPSVAAPRGGAGNNKRAPLRDRRNEERFSEEDSDGEVAWRSPAGDRARDGAARDMRQLRPYYFLVRKAFVSIAEGKESPSSQIRKLYSELQRLAGDAEKEEKFFQEVRHFAMYSILVPTREPVVEKTIKFIAGLCTYPAGIKDREKDKKEKENRQENDDADGNDSPESPAKIENPLLTRMLTFSLDNHDAADKTVRFRLCQIVNLCLENLGEEAELDDDLYDRLLDNLLKRTKDKSPSVRQHACLALHRLQDPTDKECQVVNIFKFLMACDPVAEVRRQIVALIALTSHTLPELIKRTRDGNELVRKTAYVALTEKVGLKGFSIQRRISLLKNGFQDNPRVKAVVQNKLLMGWLRVSQNNKVKFLKYLDVEEEPKLMENILLFIFKLSQSDEEIEELIQEFRSIFLDEECLVPLDKLDTETAFYWRHLCCYLRLGATGGGKVPETTCATSSGSATSVGSGNADQEIVDIRGKLVPASPIKYMEYLVAYLDKMKTKENLESDEDLEEAMTIDFTCEQLLEMISVYDWSLFPNERKSMDEFLRKRIISDKTPLPVLPALLKQWRTLINPGTEIQLVAEFLSEIQAPMSTEEVMESANQFIESQTEAKAEVAMAHIRVVEIEDAIEDAVAARDFTKAAQLQEELLPVQKEYEEKKKKFQETCEDKESVVTAKVKVTSEIEDQKILLHCLTILVDTLEKTRESISSKEHLSPILLELVPGLILTGVTCHSPSVRVVAIKCLGLVSLFSKYKAQEHWDLFFQATLLDTPLVKIVALQAIFDCLLVYGIGAFNDANVREGEEESPVATPQRREEDESTEDEESESGVGEDGEEEEEEDPFQEAYELNSTGSKKTVGDKSRFIRRRKKKKQHRSGDGSVASSAAASGDEAAAGGESPPRESEEMSKSMMTILVGYLDFDSVNIQEVTLLGFAKLLLHDRIVSARLLSRTILLWFNPTAVDFKRYLAIFLEKYATKSQEHQEAILESFVPTLNQILKAPETSPLSKINFDKVCSLVTRLTAGQTLAENNGKSPTTIESPVHENMALLIVNEILKNPSGALMRPYLSTLNQLQLSPKNLTFLENLDVLARQLVDVPKDSFAKRIARKFQANVDQLLTTAKEAAEGPALDDSLVDGAAEEAEDVEAASGEVNMSERSIRGAAAKTAPTTPADPGEVEKTAPTTLPTTTTDSKSPLDEEDVEEADLEEDEPSSDEDENEQTASTTTRVRRDLRAKLSLGKIVADIEDNNSGAGRSASTSNIASDQNPSSESDTESRASTTSSKAGSKVGSSTSSRPTRSSTTAAASKHKHSPSTPGSTDQESESSTVSNSKNKKPAKKKRKKRAA